MIRWALIANVAPERLEPLAALAWERDVTDGGDPPPVRASALSDGRTALVGEEPGVSGMIDSWTRALAQRAACAVIGLDLDPDLDERYEATPTGQLGRAPGARKHAQEIGLLPRMRASANRSVSLVEGATPDAVAAAIATGLRQPSLPPALTVSPHPRGALIAAMPPGLGPSAVARHCAGLGAVWSFVWGPTHADLLVRWDVGGASGHVRWPDRRGDVAWLAERVPEMTPGRGVSPLRRRRSGGSGLGHSSLPSAAS